jgi:hypothetical protein
VAQQAAQSELCWAEARNSSQEEGSAKMSAAAGRLQRLTLKYLIDDRLDDGWPGLPTARTRCQRTGTAASSRLFNVHFQPAYELREVSLGDRHSPGGPRKRSEIFTSILRLSCALRMMLRRVVLWSGIVERCAPAGAHPIEADSHCPRGIELLHPWFNVGPSLFRTVTPLRLGRRHSPGNSGSLSCFEHIRGVIRGRLPTLLYHPNAQRLHAATESADRS